MEKNLQATDKILRITEWDANYENNRTRELKHMAWIPVSNRHDGDGYTALIDDKNGAAHLGCWLAILQVASKCEIRGTLLRDNRSPHTATSISRLTRLPAGLIQETIDRCLCKEIGWLQVVDMEGNELISREDATISQPTDYGTEGNRTEQNGTESFDRVWALYDKKTGKEQAKRYWLKHSEKTRAAIEAKIPAYVASTPDKQFRKNFSGWINPDNKLWENEILADGKQLEINKEDV